jgi:hypothetical protein
MNEQVECAWKKFFGKGWRHDETPSKIDCFEAGWKAREKADIEINVMISGEPAITGEQIKAMRFQQKLEDFQS